MRRAVHPQHLPSAALHAHGRRAIGSGVDAVGGGNVHALAEPDGDLRGLILLAAHGIGEGAEPGDAGRQRGVEQGIPEARGEPLRRGRRVGRDGGAVSETHACDCHGRIGGEERSRGASERIGVEFREVDLQAAVWRQRQSLGVRWGWGV